MRGEVVTVREATRRWVAQRILEVREDMAELERRGKAAPAGSVERESLRAHWVTKWSRLRKLEASYGSLQDGVEGCELPDAGV